MKFNRLNILILFGFVAIVGVIIMQLLLLNQAFMFEKKELENKIHFALQDVVKKIYADNNSSLPITNQIQKVSDNYYIVNVNDVFENNVLEHYLKTEFSKVKLEQDFEYAIYNCGTDDMMYGNYISSSGEAEKKCVDCFTKDSDLIYYFAIRFPHLKQNLFKSLNQYWIFTFVLFLVLIIYVYSVFLLLKQKRYTELQTDFINNMTHEFKTPLSSILIASNFANSQKEIKENAKLSKYVQIIIEQSNKLNQHIEQILSLARTDSHQIHLQKTEVDLFKNLELIIENLKLKHTKNFDFTIDNSTKIIINADEFHFYNLLYNLVDNAIKYGIENPKVDIKVVETNSHYIIQLNDNGPGIPEKDLPFIFDKFYRVSRKDTEEIEGFGIGLAYVKKICELHHWKIKVKNTDNGLQTDIEIPKK
ncbi:two-component sensor histidine kinase [Flavobacterium okayamense]|uniref:histidine kinase n=2 Tax=Flavobacterium okayamense TaxID=2830782 RepID=A0ABM7S2M0_9FLAO|nr:two-component sensor histidine kinase [Flavobacterium okayamense]